MSAGPVQRSEVASECGAFRYHLSRAWPDLIGPGRSVLFVLLNPSTADGSQDDPTVRRLMDFARRWGCCELGVVNLFARRATAPSDLWRLEGDLVGPENDRHIRTAALLAAASESRIVCAWGAHGWEQRCRVEAVLSILREATDELGVFGWTSGTRPQPRHPLYLPRATPLSAWRIDAPRASADVA